MSDPPTTLVYHAMTGQVKSEARVHRPDYALACLCSHLWTSPFSLGGIAFGETRPIRVQFVPRCSLFVPPLRYMIPATAFPCAMHGFFYWFCMCVTVTFNWSSASCLYPAGAWRIRKRISCIRAWNHLYLVEMLSRHSDPVGRRPLLSAS